MADQKRAIDILQDLVETCRDGQNGYREAAEHVKDSTLKTYFNEISLERAKFAGELETEIHRLGEPDKQDDKGSIGGRMHRAWLDLKEKMGGGDHTILESVEAGEDTAKKSYQDALQDQSLPSSLHEIIERQSLRVIAAHDRVRDLRDATKAA